MSLQGILGGTTLQRPHEGEGRCVCCLQCLQPNRDMADPNYLLVFRLPSSIVPPGFVLEFTAIEHLGFGRKRPMATICS